MRKSISSICIYFLSWSLKKSQETPKGFCAVLVKMPSKNASTFWQMAIISIFLFFPTIRLPSILFKFSWIWNGWQKLKHCVTVHKRLSFILNACCCSPAHFTKILPQKKHPAKNSNNLKLIKLGLTGFQHLEQEITSA